MKVIKRFRQVTEVTATRTVHEVKRRVPELLQ